MIKACVDLAEDGNYRYKLGVINRSVVKTAIRILLIAQLVQHENSLSRSCDPRTTSTYIFIFHYYDLKLFLFTLLLWPMTVRAQFHNERTREIKHSFSDSDSDVLCIVYAIVTSALSGFEN